MPPFVNLHGLGCAYGIRLVKQLKEYKYKEQQCTIVIACVDPSPPGPKHTDRAVIPKKQQEHQYEKEKRAVIRSSQELVIRHVNSPPRNSTGIFIDIICRAKV